jgi:hypothetical protein
MVNEPIGVDAAMEELSDELSEEALLAFLPLHKRALGLAFGIVGGLVVFAVTVFHITVLGSDYPEIWLLRQYFYGYEVSWKGAFIGLFWGFVTCFVFGWFAAFMRNLTIAAAVFIARTRDELRQTRDFLDHI